MAGLFFPHAILGKMVVFAAVVACLAMAGATFFPCAGMTHHNCGTLQVLSGVCV